MGKCKIKTGIFIRRLQITENLKSDKRNTENSQVTEGHTQNVVPWASSNNTQPCGAAEQRVSTEAKVKRVGCAQVLWFP
jgi:hypothetical protein